MSSDIEYSSIRGNSYARYNSYHCSQCDKNVSMNQLSEHMAKYHHGMRFDADPSSDTNDDVDSMDNGTGQNIASKKMSTNQSKFGQNYVEKQQHGAAAAGAAGAATASVVPASADAAIAQTSGDETDFHPFHPKLAKKKGLFDDDDDGNDWGATSTPNVTGKSERSTTRNRMRPAKSFYNSADNKQRKIPTAHELFNDIPGPSEFRAPLFSSGEANGGGGGVTDGGYDGDRARRYGPKYKRPVQRAQVIPENFAACQYCSNLMHQDYIQTHIERKHRHSRPVAANESLLAAQTNGMSFNGPNNVDLGNRNYDETDGAGVDINGGQVSKIKTANEPNFIRCKLCSAHMHYNYMPLHLVRKHRPEYEGSTGFIWTQYTDNQVNQLLNSNRVYVKNGAIYIDELK